MKKVFSCIQAGRHTAAPAFSLLAAVLCVTPAIAQKTTCDVHTYGAKGDGKTKDTAAIQAAIDACSKKGGGTVKLAGGIFLSAPVVLKSNITLHLEPGAVLFGSPDHGDYPFKEEFRDKGRQSLVSATNAENITITGGGTIDGNGQSWWDTKSADYGVRPRLVVFDHCKHIKMENITVQNSPMWQIVPYYTDDVVIRNIKVLAPNRISHNTDAIDPFSSTHVIIDHVYADTGDDNIAIKSGQPGSSAGDAPSRDITITDCTFLHGHGLSIGSEIAGGVQNVRAERITFKGTDNGIRVKSGRDRGNDIGNFVFRDITMENVKNAIILTQYYGAPKRPIAEEQPQPVTPLTPHFHDITIENVKATGGQNAGEIAGLPESPIKSLTLHNVSISATKGMPINYAEVNATNFEVKVEQGEAIIAGKGVAGKLK
jgi:polygalacturonase